MIIKHKLDGITGERLRHLHDVPHELYFAGTDPGVLLQQPSVAIVGSRKMSPYGRAVTERLAAELARAGAVVVSGLALGVDAAAHRACLDAGGKTIAVLPSSPDTIYPASHLGLARDIVEQGGALVSEYGSQSPALKYTFIARNRIIAALADAVLIPEAALKSGSLHTADFALDLGKPVLAVPGPITSPTSEGAHQLIKNGAYIVTGVQDILDVLGVEQGSRFVLEAASLEEQLIINALREGTHYSADLLEQSGLDTTQFAHTLTMLEIEGRIRAIGSDAWALA